jgi:hypothetical protein
MQQCFESVIIAAKSLILSNLTGEASFRLALIVILEGFTSIELVGPLMKRFPLQLFVPTDGQRVSPR